MILVIGMLQGSKFNENDIKDEFLKISNQEKMQTLLLDSRIEVSLVETLLEPTKHWNGGLNLLNSEIKAKIDTACTDECQQYRSKALQDISIIEMEFETESEEQEKLEQQYIEYFEKTSDTLEQMSGLASKMKELYPEDKEKTRQRLLLTLENNKEYINNNDYEAMKQTIESEEDIQEIIDKTQKEFKANQRKFDREVGKQHSIRRKTKAYFRDAKEGILSMSKTEALSKTADAVSKVSGAISKFQSGDTMKQISGALDIADTICSFLPPPASIISSTISGIFNLFVPQEPPMSNEELEESINNMINEQTEAIGNMIDDQTKVIRELFSAQKSFILKEFKKQTELISKQFSKLEYTIQNENIKQTLKETKTRALGELKVMEITMDIIDDFDFDADDTSFDDILDIDDIKQYIREIEKVTDNIDSYCLEYLVLFPKDRPRRSLCILMVNIYVSLNMQADVAISKLTNYCEQNGK